MRFPIGILILVMLAPPAYSCSCAGEMRQLLLDRAQFVAEVTAMGEGELRVERVIRGSADASGGSFRVSPNTVLQPLDCCDRGPNAIVKGQRYWAISPEQPTIHGKRLDLSDVQVLKHDDWRADYLSHLHDLKPEELRAVLTTSIGAADLPTVSSCIRGYYHRLLMDVARMALGNEDHARCASEDAARVRVASATAALASLSFIQNEGQAGRLVCARSVTAVKFMPEIVDRQIRQTHFLYPCTDARARGAESQEEADVTTAVLDAYFNAMHGQGSRDRISLYFTNIKPARTQLEVRVFSPANLEPSRQYASPDVRRHRDDLMARSTQLAELRAAWPPYIPNVLRASDCSAKLDKMYADAVAVSRPGFDGHNKALIYLEYFGGGRAYYLTRQDVGWKIDWYVELWQCG